MSSLPSAGPTTARAARHIARLGLSLLLAAATARAQAACRVSSDSARRAVASDAARIVAALGSADMAALARRVHPLRGVRFSPYVAVDTVHDVTLPAGQLGPTLRSTRARVWGTDDGSGEPIRLTFRAYLHRFASDRDFARAPTITYNAPGERARDVWDAYPCAIVAEFAVPETDERPAESLLLVFERYRGAWYLRGVVHAGWTI
jgi:hypothetical protein